MINLQISNYLTKLSDDELDYLSETLSMIIKENPKTKILLMDDSRDIAIEKCERIMASEKIMKQVREILFNHE